MLNRQSPRNRMLYADLLTEAHATVLQTGRGISFVSKTLKGRRYWYLSVAVGRARRQTYLGPDTPELRARIEGTQAGWTQAGEAVRERQRVVALLKAGGAVPTPRQTGAALSLLAESGVFEAGAMLTGALTYAAYANLLGVRWSVEPPAAPERIALAIDPHGVDWGTLRQAHGGRRSPGEALLGQEPATRDTGSGEHLDVLTPLRDHHAVGPVFVERAGVHAHPLPHLDYVLAQPHQALLLVRHGIPVRVPEPARFALHTLAVPEHRDHAWHGNPTQNLPHTLELLRALVHEAPEGLREAFASARQHSAAFHVRLQQACSAVPGEVGAKLRKIAEPDDQNAPEPSPGTAV